MDVGHVRVLVDLCSNLASQPAHHVDVLAGDTELHRIAHRRAILQSRHATTQAREVLAHTLDQPTAQSLAGFDAVGQHDELGEAGRRQLLIQRQVETRRAGADVSHVVVDAGPFLE